MPWIYTYGLNDDQFASMLDESGNYTTEANGSAIEITQTGIVTKLRVRIAAGRAFKIGLYNSAGTLLAQGSGEGGGSGMVWAEVAITEVSVQPGTYYVLVSGSTSDSYMGYYAFSNGVYCSMAYASAMSSSVTLSTRTNIRFGVGVFIKEVKYQTYKDTGTLSAGETLTTASRSFTAGQLVVVIFANEDGALLSSPVDISNSGTAQTWTEFADAVNLVGYCEVHAWSCVMSVSQSMTISVSGAADTASEGAIYTIVHEGQHENTPIPALNVSSGAGPQDTSVAITPSGLESCLWFFTADANATNSYVARTDCLIHDSHHVAGAFTTALIRPTTQPRADNSAFTIGATDTEATPAWIAFEVRAIEPGPRSYEVAEVNVSHDTITVPRPSGMQEHDWLFLVPQPDAVAATVYTWPSGFTELVPETLLTRDGHTFACAWKRATASEPDDYSVTFNSLSSHSALLCFRVRGRSRTQPPTVGTVGVSNAANASPLTMTAGGVTALAGDDLYYIPIPDLRNAGGATGFTPPSGYTEWFEQLNIAGQWCHVTVAYKENVAAGATGDVSGQFAFTTADSGWGAFLIRMPIEPTLPAQPAAAAYRHLLVR